MTSEPFDPEALGRRIFGFGVITDTHANQGEEDCNSPFEVNHLANRRYFLCGPIVYPMTKRYLINIGEL